MLVSVFLALFLPCAGMSAVFVVYLCLLWYATIQQNEEADQFRPPVKPAPNQGLSASELEKIPKVSVKELVMGNECAVCLDEIEDGQPARLLPGCNHGFHLQCADTWLSKHSVCPICRAKLDSQFFSDSDQNPC
ncbi:E3 ubiquitin-protein ligase ATL23 [Humulus lupulus]|uniref:E3 ubiquitin-protein ligase ATL23 n=1 Tax=Humulus lupulus TaxID=3486 RepID=UPI002B4138D7|nr:E3 ubiquitin-protein ligase ATL23 [Humulus lupulus]